VSTQEQSKGRRHSTTRIVSNGHRPLHCSLRAAVNTLGLLGPGAPSPAHERVDMGGPTPRAQRTPRGHSHAGEHVVELELYHGREREVRHVTSAPAPARPSTSPDRSSTAATRRAPGPTSLPRPSTPTTPRQRLRARCPPERSFTAGAYQNTRPLISSTLGPFEENAGWFQWFSDQKRGTLS